MQVSDIHFAESCCAEHSLVAEYIRSDGIGFGLKKSPASGLFHVSVYEADGKTLRAEHVDLNEADVDALLESE